MLTMVHAENGDVVDTLIKQHLADGKVEPKYHATTRPALAESEATGRGFLWFTCRVKNRSNSLFWVAKKVSP